MKIVKAPKSLPFDMGPSVFLAGSIEEGKAVDWQTKLTNGLKVPGVTVLNPRRSDWDESWEQTIEDDQFRGQVEWELAAQETADVIAMYYDPETKSPITLLELGLFCNWRFCPDGRPKKMLVCCPKGFWRKGNVDIVCQRYGVEQVSSLETLISETRQLMRALCVAERIAAQP